jgi:uncharacterized membrane protein YecN with MAPEG domain
LNQTSLAAVGLYAALSTFVLVWLTVATGQLRRRHKVLIGDGGVAHLARIMRGHANAIENIPMMMVLLLVAALLGAPVLAIHLLGAGFVAARALHAWHFIQEHGAQWQRALGFSLGALTMLLAAIGLLSHAIRLLA